MPNPTSPASEWVEFYNPDNLDISNYWIDDDTSFTDDSGSSTKKSLSSVVNNNQTYPYIDLSSILNNSGDYVVLFGSDETIIDQHQYTSDPGKDKTIGKSPDGGSFITLETSTKGSSNGSSAAPTPSPTPTPTPSSTATPTPTPTSAPTSNFTISNIPNKINSDQSFSVQVTLSIPGNANTTYYLKGAFKKSDGARYLGLTKYNSDWIEYGEDYSEQYKITTDNSAGWSGSIEVKPDIYDKDYKGSGDYIFKIGRLTAAGSGPTWSNESTITINDTSVKTSTPDPSPTPTTTSLVNSSTSSSSIEEKETEDNPYQNLMGSSLGITTQSATEETKVESAKHSPNFILIAGFILIGASALMYYLRLKRNQLKS